MRQVIAFLFIIFTFSNCNDPLIINGIEQQELEPGTSLEKFKTVTVDFHLHHPEFTLRPPVFDTIEEQILFKDAYNEGATFETVTEQVLEKEGHTFFRIMNIKYTEMLSNAEDSLYCEVPCIQYFEEADFEVLSLPSTYRTITSQRLHENGTGDYIEPQYKIRSYLKLVEDAVLEERQVDSLQLLRKEFTIPIELDFETYWEEQLIAQSIFDCGERITYEVVE